MDNMDRNELEEQVLRYSTKLGEIVSFWVNDPEDQKDVKQDFWIKVMGGISKFKGKSQLDTWLYRVAVNTAKAYHRKKFRRREVGDELLANLPDLEYDEKHRADKALVRKEIHELLNRGIKKLTPNKIRVINYILEDKSYQEIGQIMGVVEGTVGNHLHHAKRRLTMYLKKY